MKNVPEVRAGIVAVSRDCFPIELSMKRRQAIKAACVRKKIELVECETMVENETDALRALLELKDKAVNALVLFLGNFGPEGPTSLLAQKFDGPVMMVAAAEETRDDLINGRGDAYCGLLSNSYNNGLRRLRLYFPEYPVGDSEQVAEMIREFIPVARVMIGIKSLKIFSFGPRPQDFYTCHVPIQPLFDLGVEIMENSELDLYDICQAAKEDPLVKEVAQAMSDELGVGNSYPDLVVRLAQYEVALRHFMEKNLGASRYGIFANKCWPAFQKYFGHVPCYINGRLAAEGIPVACEADVYGALSEYMIACATLRPPAILDVNNTVPKDMVQANKEKMKNYRPTDLFMGFHCGNVSAGCMMHPTVKHQLIMHRLLEPDQPPNITRGTLEGRIAPNPITLYRLQATAESELKSYVAQGEILDVDPQSFGGIAVFAVPEMGRFYRHVLIAKRFPHHTAVAFDHAGKTLFSASKLLGVNDISFNQPVTDRYADENLF